MYMNPFAPKITPHEPTHTVRYTPLGRTITDPCYSATFGVQIDMRAFEELKNFQLGWSTKDLLQEGLNRQLQFLMGLHNAAPLGTPTAPCTFTLRLVRQETTAVLSIIMVAKAWGKSSLEAYTNAEDLWNCLQASIPYDYFLEPVSEEEYADQVNLDWLSNHSTQPPDITVLTPFVGFLYTPNQNGHRNQPIPVIGKWTASQTSPELIWRTIMHLPAQLSMDIFLQPTQLLPHERWALVEVIDRLSDIAKNSHGLAKWQAEQWLDNYTKRLHALDLVYLLQIRLASTHKIPHQTIAAIGSALTADQHNGKQMDYSHYHAHRTHPTNGLKALTSLEFINLRVPITPSLRRLPFIATAQEALSAFRLPILPKGGIPDLNLQTNKGIKINADPILSS